MSTPHPAREAVAFYRTGRGKLVVYMKGRPALQCRNGPTLRNGPHCPFAKYSTVNQPNTSTPTPRGETPWIDDAKVMLVNAL